MTIEEFKNRTENNPLTKGLYKDILALPEEEQAKAMESAINTLDNLAFAVDEENGLVFGFHNTEGLGFPKRKVADLDQAELNALIEDIVSLPKAKQTKAVNMLRIIVDYLKTEE